MMKSGKLMSSKMTSPMIGKMMGRATVLVGGALIGSMLGVEAGDLFGGNDDLGGTGVADYTGEAQVATDEGGSGLGNNQNPTWTPDDTAAVNSANSALNDEARFQFNMAKEAGSVWSGTNWKYESTPDAADSFS